MKGLNELISVAMKVAQKWTKECKTRHASVSLGATEGQVLWSNPAGRMEMLPCWMEIRIVNFQGTGKFKIALSPILPINKFKPICFRENVYPNDVFLNDVTGFHHTFGGETVEFRRGIRIEFDLDKDIDRQIYLCARTRIPAFEYYIYEDDGDLVLVGNTVFGLGDTADSYVDDDDSYVRFYDELVFIEFDGDEDIEREELLSRAVNTGRNAIIVPTIWIKDDGQRECFLGFKADWSQPRHDKRIAGRVGKFIVTHEVYDDKLLMQTSLRASNSAFAQNVS